MSYLKPVVVASTLLIAGLSASVFAFNSNDFASTTNRNSPKSEVSGLNWEKRIFVGGLLNIDGVYASRGWMDANNNTDLTGMTPSFGTSNSGRAVVVNNANVFLDAKINDLTTAHVGLSYIPTSLIVSNENYITLDEVYVSFKNESSPYYAQVGKKFLSFGNYNPYPVNFSLTQLFQQANLATGQAGYNGNDGIHASVSLLGGPLSNGSSMDPTTSTSTSRINNYGVDLSYTAQLNDLSYNLGAGYLQDVRDVTFLSNLIPSLSNDYSRTVGAYELHGDMTEGPVSLVADYVNLVRNLSTNSANSKVWALNLNAGYGFDSMGYASKASFGYEGTGQAADLNIPRSRLVANYSVDMNKNAKMGVEYARNRSYCVYAGNSRISNVAKVRLGFAI